MAQAHFKPDLNIPLRWVLAIPLVLQIGLVGLGSYGFLLWSRTEGNLVQLHTLLFGILGLILTIGVGGWLLIGRCIDRAVQLLTQKIHQIEQGHFSSHPLSTHFPELDLLAEAITDMGLKVQKKVQEREMMLNLALTAGKMGTWLRDLATDPEQQQWSPEVYRQLGLDPELLPQPTRQTFLERVHPEDLHVLGKIDWTQDTGSHPSQQEFRIVRPNGEIRWLRSFGQSINDQQGKTTQVFGINKDITQDKQQETEQQATLQALRSSEVRLKALIDNLPFRIWARDPEGKLILQNPVDIAAFGNRLGTTIEDLGLDPNTYQEWKQFMGRLQAGETVYRRYSEPVQGQIRHFFSIAAPLPSDAGIGIIGISIDITEQMQAEEALRASEAKFRALVDNLPFRVWARNSEGRLVFQNPVDIAAFGNQLGTCIEEWNLPPEMYALWKARENSLKAGQTTTTRGIQIIHGQPRHFLSIDVPLEKEISGIGWLGISIDITEQMQAEEALRASEAKFRALVENLPFCVWTRDVDGRIIYQNAVDIAEFGDISGSPIEDLSILPEQIESARQNFRKIMSGQVVQNENVLVRSGEKKHFLTIGAPILEDGQPTGAIGISINISDQKRMEAALKDSEAKFRALLENLPFQVWARDAEGSLIFQSKLDRERHGDCLGYRIEDMDLPTGEILEWQNTVARIMTGEVIRKETKQNFNGEEEYLLFVGSPILQDSQIIGSLGVLIDITEQRQAEIRLEQARSQLEMALKAGHMGVWEADLITNRMWWSPEQYHILGFTDDEQGRVLDPKGEMVSGHPTRELIFDRILPSSQEMCHENIEQALLTGHYPESEYPYIRPDGELRWLLFRGELFVDGSGQKRKLLGVCTDITNRKQVELQLMQMASIVRSSTDAIISTDLRGIILTWNPGAERMYGYLADEVVGTSLQDILPGVLEHYTPSQDPHISRHRCKEGRLIDVFVTISILLDTKGDPCGTSWIIRDISYQQELERLKSEFISIVSHELRTPLTSIHGSLTTLNTGILGSLHPMGQELLQIAEQNTTRLIRLINDILDLERLDNADVPLIKQPCRCADLAAQACAMMQPLAEKAQVQIQQDLIDCTFWADPDLILQVLTNLLSNGIKFSPPHSSIHLSTQISGTEVLITVQDHGTGIPADKLELIFGRFQQVDASDSRKKGGTGLGLAICRQILQQHHGRIWAESGLGEGSIFYVALPLRDLNG